MVNGTMVGFTKNLPVATACWVDPGSSPDVFYSVTVAPGQVFQVDIQGAQTYNLSLFPSGQSCNLAASCVARENTNLFHYNATGVTENLVLAIQASGTPSTFVLSALSQPLPSTVAGFGESCTAAPAYNAPAIGMSSLLYGTTANSSNDIGSTSTTCPSLAGRDNVYAVTVPAGRSVTAFVFPLTMWDVSIAPIAPLANCSASSTCIGSSGNTDLDGIGEAVGITNPTATTQTIYFVVDSAKLPSDPTGSGRFYLYLQSQ
jgi:hypothetical protein